MIKIAISRAGMAVSGAALAFLSACSEPEEILPGIREDIRPVPEAVTQGPRPINLPAQAANANWPQGFGTPAYRTSNPSLRANPQRIWSLDIGAGESRRQRITADPVVAGGLIYTLDAAARVTAASPAGASVWSTDLLPAAEKDEQATGGGLAYDNGMLYVSSGYGRLTALDAKTGTIRWRQRLDATGSGTPTVRDGLVYLVAGDDTGWAVRTKDGRVAWQVQATPSVGNVLGAPAPALTSDLVVFAFGSGDVIASFRRGGVRRWSGAVSGERRGRTVSQISDITGSPVISGGRVFVGNHSGRTVAFDAVSGDRLWTAREGALTPVWPAGDSVFLISDRNQLIRMRASDGAIVWARDLPGFLKDKPRRRGAIVAHYGPVLAGGRLVVASNDGYLRFFDPASGDPTGRVEVPDGATTGPVIAGGTLYVVSTKGELHAFR